MIIAIPLSENNKNSAICPSFGRAPFYLIYNTDTATHTIINNAAANAAGGAGIKAAQSLVDANIDVLITPRCGENAAKVLLNSNILLYKNIDAGWEENITAFQKSELKPLNNIHPGYHGAN